MITCPTATGKTFPNKVRRIYILIWGASSICLEVSTAVRQPISTSLEVSNCSGLFLGVAKASQGRTGLLRGKEPENIGQLVTAIQVLFEEVCALLSFLGMSHEPLLVFRCFEMANVGHSHRGSFML